MRITGTLLAFIISITALYGQIDPPQLNCIEGDGTEIHIQWAPPAAPCGPVTGYEVFHSTQEQGPYQSFTINNPGVIDTVFPGGEPVYCYMQSLMNCPGEIPVPSDTLIWDLSPPIMQAVSVNSSNQVEVSWYPSESQDVSAYLVYVDGANFPDTVYGNGSSVYTDLVSDPQTASHTYELAWFRECTDATGRRGAKGNPYQSILAQNLVQDICDRSFRFVWTPYVTYVVFNDGYEIEVSINGSAYTPVDTVENSTQIFTYDNANTDDYYCFRINVLLTNGFKATSNEICDTARVVDIPIGAHVRNATVISDNQVDIEYYPDTTGLVDLFRAQRSEGGSIFRDWPVTNTGTAGVPVYEIYRDGNSVTQSRPYSYRFYREDECANSYITDTVKTIYLDADLDFGLTADLQWTAYYNTNGTVVRYIINKIISGDTTQFATTSPTMLEYEDESALNPSSLDTVCYFITAEIDLDIDGVISTQVISKSNVVCLEPTPRIITPSAFKPEGFNSIFVPIIQFGTNVNYNMRIWDRWGKKLFESNDINVGWDGTYKNAIVPLENYVFYITFEGQDGNMYSKAGNVIVVR